jgi:hypothetical protein
MASNAQKTHFALDQNRFAQQKILTAIQRVGKSLPCSVVAVSGSIVTVNFEVNSAPFTLPQVTVPLAVSHYYFEPTQIGDTGYVVPADTYLGQISELGGGVPDLTVPGNLSALVFHPVAKKSWTPTDPNKAEIFGPAGAILRNGDGTSIITVSDDSITLAFSSHSIVINGDGVTIDGILWDTHEHTDVQMGGDKTGGPVSP